jgi:hypothetical protein
VSRRELGTVHAEAEVPLVGYAKMPTPRAILAKAFRGELVPTEAELARAEGRDYEPASVLLERIRREREAAGPTAGRGRKKAAPEKASAKATSPRPQR